MSNKDFFKSNEYQFYNLDTQPVTSLYFGRFTGDVQKCKILYKGNPILYLCLSFSKRCIKPELFYCNLLDCVYSPYELQRWCCSLFQRVSNYSLFLVHLERDLNYLFKMNPNLLLPY